MSLHKEIVAFKLNLNPTASFPMMVCLLLPCLKPINNHPPQTDF